MRLSSIAGYDAEADTDNMKGIAVRAIDSAIEAIGDGDLTKENIFNWIKKRQADFTPAFQDAVNAVLDAEMPDTLSES